MKYGVRFTKCLALTAVLVTSLSATGCLSMFSSNGRGSSGSSSSSSSGYRGTVTVENRSQLHVCAITHSNTDTTEEVALDVAPGASATFQAAATVRHVQVLECGTNRLLYGNPLAWMNDQQEFAGGMLSVGKLVLLDPGASPATTQDSVSLVLAPKDGREALRDAFFAVMARRADDGRTFSSDEELSAQALSMIQRGGRSQGWTENFTAAVITWADWEPVREWQMTPAGRVQVTIARDHGFVAGARWPNGHCTVQNFGLRQPFDGSSPQGEVGFHGTGAQWPIPCALLTLMESYPNAAH